MGRTPSHRLWPRPIPRRRPGTVCPRAPGAAGVFRSPGPDGAPGAAGRREPSSGLDSPHPVSRFVYFVTLIPSNSVDFGARQTNQSSGESLRL